MHYNQYLDMWKTVTFNGVDGGALRTDILVLGVSILVILHHLCVSYLVSLCQTTIKSWLP